MSIERPKITINLSEGGLGRVSPVGDGIAGLILPLATAPVSHAHGVAKSYTSYNALPTEMKVPALELFYAVAPGVKVWIMPVPTTATVPDIVNSAHAQAYAKNLIAAAGGEIRFIAIAAAHAHATLATAVTNAQALANETAAKYDPVLMLLPCKYNAAIPDLTIGSANRVAAFISETGKEAGLLLGRLAATPVQRHIGRVKDGAMPITEFMLGDKKAEEADDRVAEVVGKGYITLGTIRGKSGYYYETQPLATNPAGDYSIISNRRVIDKAVLIAYQTYMNELKDEIEIAADGTIAPGVIKHYQSLIENAINQQMAAFGNISGARAFMDVAQNVLSTGKIEVDLFILPVGYAEEIVVNLGFTTSLEE